MQQFELSEELVSQIEGLIKADNKEDVSKLVEPLHSADIAEIMNELDTKEAQFLFLLLDEEKAGDVLAEIEEDERQRLEAIILPLSIFCPHLRIYRSQRLMRR